jgi:tight adherence protein C
MTLLIPPIVFIGVFAAVLVASYRSHRSIAQLRRHEMVPGAGGTVAVQASRLPILTDGLRSGIAGNLAGKVTRKEARTKSAKLLREAGSPMRLGTFLAMRAIFTFGLTPLYLLLVWTGLGATPLGIISLIIGGFCMPQLPMLRIKRRARKRAKAIELAMPDALDLLVVCAEGGLSLDGSVQQVSLRTQGIVADEFGRLLLEIGSGMPRRDAFLSLGERSQSESLKIFTATIIQADKMGMSIATTLRTLADTMRTRRRQAAETQARKAPIKMLPFLVIFMIPSLFIVILGPAVLSIINLMKDT